MIVMMFVDLAAIQAVNVTIKIIQPVHQMIELLVRDTLVLLGLLGLLPTEQVVENRSQQHTSGAAQGASDHHVLQHVVIPATLLSATG